MQTLLRRCNASRSLRLKRNMRGLRNFYICDSHVVCKGNTWNRATNSWPSTEAMPPGDHCRLHDFRSSQTAQGCLTGAAAGHFYARVLTLTGARLQGGGRVCNGRRPAHATAGGPRTRATPPGAHPRRPRGSTVVNQFNGVPVAANSQRPSSTWPGQLGWNGPPCTYMAWYSCKHDCTVDVSPPRVMMAMAVQSSAVSLGVMPWWNIWRYMSMGTTPPK
jgi:hypothetical protein